MSLTNLDIKDYIQQYSVSCLAASALICLNYLDPKKWELTSEMEKLLAKNIRFDELHDFGCYPKLIDYAANQGFRVTYLLGSVPEEKDSDEKSLYNIWIEAYNKISSRLDNSIEIKFISKDSVLKEIDYILLERRTPIIFYSESRWHNMVLYGKRNDNEYLVFDPIAGRKIFNYTQLKKNMLSAWGINAIYIENGNEY
jgi:DNA helicase HerA-like ATPase